MNKKNSKKGFVALFMVTLTGLAASMFVVSSATRAWIQSKNVFETHNMAVVKFNALSCVNIGRLKIFLADASVVGTYETGEGDCKVESINVGPAGILTFKTSANKNDIGISLESEVDSSSFKIISIKEI